MSLWVQRCSSPPSYHKPHKNCHGLEVSYYHEIKVSIFKYGREIYPSPPNRGTRERTSIRLVSISTPSSSSKTLRLLNPSVVRRKNHIPTPVINPTPALITLASQQTRFRYPKTHHHRYTLHIPHSHSPSASANWSSPTCPYHPQPHCSTSHSYCSSAGAQSTQSSYSAPPPAYTRHHYHCASSPSTPLDQASGGY